MPAAVTARYEACQAAALCGAFPAIRRAYAAVDASLFLWRYDVWGDAPVEYGGEDQAITAVGLAPARPGVFVDAVTHLLVVATTVEVTLVGVCADGGGRGELALQPLPGFSAATDGVALACVAATPGGRILAGGGDGRVYEVEYGAGGGGGW
jgi:nuclear pore complex protein Nup155